MGSADDAKNAFLQGMREFNFGDQDKALAYFESAIKLFDLADGWLGKGMVLGKRGETREAIAAFDRALNARPNYARAWWHKGKVFKSIGEMDQALDAYEHAVAGDFGEDDMMRPAIEHDRNELLAEIQYSKATKLLQDGAHAQALEVFEQMQAEVEADPRLLLGMSVALIGLERREEGINRLLEAWRVRGRTTDVNLVNTIEDGLRSYGIEPGNMDKAAIIQASAKQLSRVYPADDVRKAIEYLAAKEAAREATSRSATALARLKWDSDRLPDENLEDV